MDWGYAKPFAIYWIAVDYEGRGYVYREWYGCQTDAKGQIKANEGIRMEPERVAQKIAAIEEGEAPVFGVADPSCWSKGQGDHGGGPSVIDAMGKFGVYFTAGKNDRISGKMEFHTRLTFERDAEGLIREYPGLIFIGEECPHAIRTIPALEYDKHRVEDVDSSMEDHSYDSIRYFGMSRPWTPKTKIAQPKWMSRKAVRSGWQ
jgi:hypothetical protein